MMKTKECYEKHTNCNGDYCNMNRFKWIDFAYPTSDNAKKFGAYSTGCYVIYTATKKGLPKAFKAYMTEQEAINSANTMPHQWWPVYVNQGRKIA